LLLDVTGMESLDDGSNAVPRDLASRQRIEGRAGWTGVEGESPLRKAGVEVLPETCQLESQAKGTHARSDREEARPKQTPGVREIEGLDTPLVDHAITRRINPANEVPDFEGSRETTEQGVPRSQEGRTGIDEDVFPAGQGDLLRAHAATRLELAFEYLDVIAGSDQSPGAAKARDSRSDDHHGRQC
jgi:hypothetical protein